MDQLRCAVKQRACHPPKTSEDVSTTRSAECRIQTLPHRRPVRPFVRGRARSEGATRMPSSRAKRKRKSAVRKRDSSLCGIHLGGCGKLIHDGDTYDVDHIIPQSFFELLDSERKRRFESRWNLQPMHRECHEKNRSGQFWSFPIFQCQCHSLHIKHRVLYLRYNCDLVIAIWDKILNKELLIAGLGPVRIQRSGRIGSLGHKPGSYTHGKAVGNKAHYTGHSLPTMSDEEIREFNMLEDNRLNGTLGASIDKFNRYSVDSDTGLSADSMTIRYEVKPDPPLG